MSRRQSDTSNGRTPLYKTAGGFCTPSSNWLTVLLVASGLGLLASLLRGLEDGIITFEFFIEFSLKTLRELFIGVLLIKLDSLTNDNSEQKAETKKMQREILDSRIRTKERGKEFSQIAEREISRIVESLDGDRSLETLSNAIFHRALDEKLIENRTFSDVATASVYSACRVDSLPHTLREITEETQSEKKEIGRTYAEMSKNLDLKVGPVDPEKFIHEYCQKLDLDNKIEQRATELLEMAKEENFHSGRSQSVLATSSIYIAAQLQGEFISQSMLSNVSGVNERTVREVYQKQIKIIGSEFTLEDAFRLTDRDLVLSKLSKFEDRPEELLEILNNMNLADNPEDVDLIKEDQLMIREQEN